MTGPEIGERQVTLWRFTQPDFDTFAALSGDDNPIHVDADFAAQTQFGQTVAHGMLLMGVVHGRLARWLNRPVITAHTMMFAAPTYADRDVAIRLAVARRNGPAYQIQTEVVHPGAEPGLTGQASVRTDGKYAPLPPHAKAGSRQRAALGFYAGQFAMRKKAFGDATIDRFATLIDDPELPRDHIPPALLGGLISDLLGTTLPGPGTNWLKLRLHLGRAVAVGEHVVGRVTVTRLRPEKALVNLRTTILDADDTPVADGEALVLVRDVAT